MSKKILEAALVFAILVGGVPAFGDAEYRLTKVQVDNVNIFYEVHDTPPDISGYECENGLAHKLIFMTLTDGIVMGVTAGVSLLSGNSVHAGPTLQRIGQ